LQGINPHNTARQHLFAARGKLNGLDVRAGGGQPVAAKTRYFFCTDGHGAPQGAQAPAKSSGDTGRPLDGEDRCCVTSAANAITKTMA
jgi:hypothetical protein